MRRRRLGVRFVGLLARGREAAPGEAGRHVDGEGGRRVGWRRLGNRGLVGHLPHVSCLGAAVQTHHRASWLTGGWRRAGQQFVAGLRNDRRSLARLEPRDQTELAFGAAHLVPGKPETVGATQLRLAVVLGQLIGEIDELLLRRGVAAILIRVVEGEDAERAVDRDGSALLVVVEHHAAGEPAHAGHPRRGQRFFAPEFDHARGDLRFGRRIPESDLFGKIPGSASARRPHEQEEGEHGWRFPGVAA